MKVGFHVGENKAKNYTRFAQNAPAKCRVAQGVLQKIQIKPVISFPAITDFKQLANDVVKEESIHRKGAKNAEGKAPKNFAFFVLLRLLPYLIIEAFSEPVLWLAVKG